MRPDAEYILELNAKFWQDMGLLELHSEQKGFFATRSDAIQEDAANYTYISEASHISLLNGSSAYFIETEGAMLQDVLKQQGYEPSERDVLIWGHLSGLKTADKIKFPHMSIVVSDTLSNKDFLKVFRSACYADVMTTAFSSIDKGYIQQYSLDSAEKHRFRQFHYIAYADGVPVGIASAITNDEWVGIYNVCTDPACRNLEYITDAIFTKIKEDMQAISISNFFGVTAGNSILERWYRMKGGKICAYASTWKKAPLEKV